MAAFGSISSVSRTAGVGVLTRFLLLTKLFFTVKHILTHHAYHARWRSEVDRQMKRPSDEAKAKVKRKGLIRD